METVFAGIDLMDSSSNSHADVVRGLRKSGPFALGWAVQANPLFAGTGNWIAKIPLD